MYLYTQSEAQYPLVQWAQKLQAGSAFTNTAPYSYISECVLDNNGNIYVVGFFADTLYPDPASASVKLVANANDGDAVFFAKYNPAGGLIWAKAVGTGHGLDLALDRLGNIYITGYGNSTDSADFDPGPGRVIYTSGTDFMFMCKYDNNGNYLKSRFFSGVGVKGLGIATDSSYNVYVSGCVRNPVDFDPGPGVTSLTRHNTSVNRDGFYARYDSSMNLVWARLDVQTRDCEDIAVNEVAGRVLVASQALRLVNLNGITTDSLITNIKGTNAVKFDDSGNMYFSGYFSDVNVNFNWNGNNTLSTTGPNDENGFLVKYNAAKVFQWANKYKVNYDVSSNRVNTLNENLLLAYFESDGVLPHRGFLKINPATGLQIGRAADIVTNTGGERLTTALYSNIDNSILFTGSAGRGNNPETVDFDPDTATAAIQNITGMGVWGYMAKYSNCTAAPAQPGAIAGSLSLCGTDAQMYSIIPVSGATKYNWVLPNGWSGSSDSSKIIVQPSANGGVVSVTAENVCGVSTARTLNVTYTAPPVVTINASSLVICAGEQVTLSGNGATSYNWNNNVNDGVAFAPSSTTTYYVTGTTNGCTDTASVTIQVQQPTGSSLSESICAGQSYTFGGNTLTVAGTYYDTLSNVAGCDSAITLTLTVLQNDNTFISTTICNGETYPFNGTLLATSGTYYDTVTNTAGCYAITTLTLIVNQPTGSSLSASICPGQGYPFNGNVLIAPGVYYDTLQNASGCDSIITLTLTYRQPTSSALAAAICPGQSYPFNGINRTTAGVYRDTLVNSVGCDSIITLTLTLKQNTSSVTSAAICEGRSYFFNGASLTMQGVYRDTLVNTAGCDSIIILNLTVTPSQNTLLQASICSGAFYQFGNRQLNQSGIYTDTLPAFSTCDSIITLELQVDSILTTTTNASVCQGSSYNFNGQQLAVAGTYYDTLSATTGCDSVVTLVLQVNQLPALSVSPTFTKLCQGDSVELTATGNGSFIWSDNNTSNSITVLPVQNTTYNVTITDGNNCTTSQSVQVEVNAGPVVPVIQQQNDTLLAGTTDSCTWYLEDSLIAGATQNILIITQNGSYSVEVTDSNGCSRKSQAFIVIGLSTDKIFSSLSWSLYPNPAEEYVQINCPGCSNGFTAEIYNTMGSIIGTLSVAGSGSELDVKQWAPGVYFIKAQSGVYSKSARFIKK